MEKKEKITGICSTCDHVEGCLYRFESGLVIWFCEQFENQTSAKPMNFSVGKKLPTPPVEQNDYLGLCVNCEHREECIHAKTPGGIWQCEEYS